MGEERACLFTVSAEYRYRDATITVGPGGGNWHPKWEVSRKRGSLVDRWSGNAWNFACALTDSMAVVDSLSRAATPEPWNEPKPPNLDGMTIVEAIDYLSGLAIPVGSVWARRDGTGAVVVRASDTEGVAYTLYAVDANACSGWGKVPVFLKQYTRSLNPTIVDIDTGKVRTLLVNECSADVAVYETKRGKRRQCSWTALMDGLTFGEPPVVTTGSTEASDES